MLMLLFKKIIFVWNFLIVVFECIKSCCELFSILTMADDTVLFVANCNFDADTKKPVEIDNKEIKIRRRKLFTTRTDETNISRLAEGFKVLGTVAFFFYLC
jgi:hypothetical protein